MNVILCERAYFDSGWCKQILQGLKNELKKRRLEYTVIFELDGEPSFDNMYFIIGSDYRFMSDSVKRANRYGITPIVIFNQLNHIISGRYHSVSSDIGGSVAALVNWLKKRNKQSICLYGVNPESVSDISRSKRYTEISEMGRIFYNNASLSACFEDFIKSGENFDAVICTNDFAAISLVKNLMKRSPELLEKTDIISCSGSFISKYFGDVIRSLDINLTSLGANAYRVARAAQAGENISEISITVKWSMDFGDGEAASEYEDIKGEPNAFYDDGELTALMNIDKLIEKSDDTDKRIIGMLLDGRTYMDIADVCHLSEQSVKYRVKQYCEICCVSNRRELVLMLSEYRITGNDGSRA